MTDEQIGNFIGLSFVVAIWYVFAAAMVRMMNENDLPGGEQTPFWAFVTWVFSPVLLVAFLFCLPYFITRGFARWMANRD